MGKFSAATSFGASDLKLEAKHNYLTELLDSGYVTEGRIGGKRVRLEASSAVALKITIDNIDVFSIDPLTGSTTIGVDGENSISFVPYSSGAMIRVPHGKTLYLGDKSDAGVVHFQIASGTDYINLQTSDYQLKLDKINNNFTLQATDKSWIHLYPNSYSADIGIMNASDQMTQFSVRDGYCQITTRGANHYVEKSLKTDATLSSAGWKRILKFTGTVANAANGVYPIHAKIILSRNYQNYVAETFVIEFSGGMNALNVFRQVSGNAVGGSIMFQAIRWVTSADGKTGYLEVYYAGGLTNDCRAYICEYNCYACEFSPVNFTAIAVTPPDGSVLRQGSLYIPTGTFTPSVIGYTTEGTPTYTTRYGYYQRDGNIVTFQIYIVLASKTGISGFVGISGLPFVSDDGNGHYGLCSIGYVGRITLSAGYTMLQAYVDLNSTKLWLLQGGSGLPAATVDVSQIAANMDIIVCGVYQCKE